MEETDQDQPPSEISSVPLAIAGPPARRSGSRLLYLSVPLLRALLFLISFILLQWGIGILLFSLPSLIGGPMFRPRGFGTSEEFVLAAFSLCLPPLVAVTWLFVRFLDRRTLASIGARWPGGGRDAALRQTATSILGAVAVLGVWLALILVLPDTLASVQLVGVSPEYRHGAPWWPLPPVLLLGFVLLGFVLQGGLEEWVMRGYIYRTLRERWRPWVSALASSTLFSLLHAWNPNVSLLALVNIVLAGMVLAALVERTGSLWSATLAHGVWNFAVACLLSVQVSGVRLFHLLDVRITGNPDLTGGGFGPEGSALLTLIGIALTALLWRGMWRRQSERAEAVAPASAPGDVLLPLSP
ncbi:MAG: CPBP family intramembrane glutamic endopeptidase [Thermoanaerobaculia bacterium]